MLPFLKRSKEASVVTNDTERRKPDDGAEYDPVHSAAQDLLSAIESKSVPAVAEALRAAYELCSQNQDEVI